MLNCTNQIQITEYPHYFESTIQFIIEVKKCFTNIKIYRNQYNIVLTIEILIIIQQSVWKLYLGSSTVRNIFKKNYSSKDYFFLTERQCQKVPWSITDMLVIDHKEKVSLINHNIVCDITRTIFLWSIINLSLIMIQGCRNVLWLIVEKDAFVMAACDKSLKFMTNQKS